MTKSIKSIRQCLASDTMMESSCATGVAGTSTYVTPLYTKETR